MRINKTLMLSCLVLLAICPFLFPRNAYSSNIPRIQIHHRLGNQVLSEGDFRYEECSLIDSATEASLGINGAVLTVYDGDDENVVIPDTLGGMNTIAVQGFEFATTVKSVKIPEGVVTIGFDTFYNCINLEAVQLPKSLKYIDSRGFCFCPKLSSIVLPEGLERIGYNAFSNCSSLKELKLPDTLRSLGAYAFQACSSLTSLFLPGNLEEIQDNENPFLRCPAEISVADDHPVLYVEDGVLFDRSQHILISYPYDSAVKEYSVPEGITIGPSAFYDVTNLSILTLPDDQVKFERNPFANMSAEFSVSDNNPAFSARDGVLYDKIGKELVAYPCFGGRSSFSIPEGTLTVGKDAFYRCSTLKEIIFPSTLESISARAFANCSSLAEVILPEHLVEIGDDAFNNCTKIEHVTLPEKLEVIGYNAFMSCRNLKTIILPEGLEAINSGTFIGCNNLQEVVLPESLSFIDPEAFHYSFMIWDTPVYVVTNGSFAEQWAKEKGATFRYNDIHAAGNDFSQVPDDFTELTVGSRGQEVLDMKQRFYELGYFRTTEFSDQFNKNTADTVRLFEKNNGLPADGVADPAMLALLFSDSAVGK